MKNKALIWLLLGMAAAAAAQWQQQGEKLVGTGAVGGANQGNSVALSADGNTLISGASRDSSGIGAAWIFTRQNGQWSQSGEKLVAPHTATSNIMQGICVAMAADGRTAVVGAPAYVGAANIWVRSGSGWTLQGAALSGADHAGQSVYQGTGVAISADGGTVIIGGHGDAQNSGAAWIFSRQGSLWSQEGSKLVGSGAIGKAQQGRSVAISEDGQTAVIGGYADHDSLGAAWIFTRTPAGWRQQGGKLVPSDASGKAMFGWAVALSGDGNTVMMGAPRANANRSGGAWIFTRQDTSWIQQGLVLAGIDTVGRSSQGQCVALSRDGSIGINGGLNDSLRTGATWVFCRSGSLWSQCGPKLVGRGFVKSPRQGKTCAISADGLTIAAGGPWDNTDIGAAWVFTQPAADFSSKRVAFASTLILSSRRDSIVVRNRGSGALTLSAAVVEGESIFRVTPAAALLANGGDSIAFRIEFTPRDPDLYTGKIRFTSENGWAETVEVTGEGMVYSIAAVRALPVGSTVALTGTVTRARGAYAWLQQDSAAIVLYQSKGTLRDSIAAGLITPGSVLSVLGKTSRYRSLLELASGDIQAWRRHGVEPLPAAEEVTLARIAADGARLQSRLVRIKYLTVLSGDPVFKAATTYNIVDPSDTSKAVALRIGNAADTEIDSMQIPRGSFMFVGPLGQFSNDPAAGFQLMPVDRSDIVLKPTGLVMQEEENPPDEYALGQNYPNPFNMETVIEYRLGQAGFAVLRVYDMLGREVAALVEGKQAAGIHRMVFSGAGLANGVYLYRLEAGNFSSTRKLVLLR